MGIELIKFRDGALLTLQDRKPVQPVPTELTADFEKEAEAEFNKLYPEADVEMDVHAAQLKAIYT